MNSKYAHKLLLAAAITLLAAGTSFALDVEVLPEEAAPGDVFLLTVKQTGHSPVEVKFHNKKIDLYPIEEDLLAALVPLDINTEPGTYNIHVYHGGEDIIAAVKVKSRTFRTIKLTLPEGKVTLSPANQKRAEKEYVLQTEIWGKNTEPAWKGTFIYPLDTEISTEFGVMRVMNKKKTSMHRGMDFRGKTGTPVMAVNSGRVVLSKDLFYGGHTLIVDHGMGLYSVYMHLSKFNVSEGMKIKKGDVVGFVGMSGRATGPHLHLSVKLKGISINPESLFKLKL